MDAAEEEAAPDAAEEEAAPDVMDAAEEEAEVCPNGGIQSGGPADCGPIPPGGLWICYTLAHDMTCGFVGLAGANPPSGEPVDPYYHDPMIVMGGGNCVAVTNIQNTVLCQLPAPSGSPVQFAPGLHTGGAATIPGRYACDAQTCRGTAHIYKNGVEVGGMQNSVTSGVVSFTPYNGRRDLTFIVP